jgi:CheY-like chemotaxis protein
MRDPEPTKTSELVANSHPLATIANAVLYLRLSGGVWRRSNQPLAFTISRARCFGFAYQNARSSMHWQRQKRVGMRVLIVEDDLMIADLVEEGLVARGIVVSGIVSTADAAVEAVRRDAPDVAIVDINLQYGSRGTDIVGRLPGSAPLGVLYTSGCAEADDITWKAGTALIVKPFSMADLITALAIIGDLLDGGATARPLPPGMRLLEQLRPAA